jgi:hypothetical protein
MPKTINQKAHFKGASAKLLFNLYVNAEKHTLSTGGVARISRKVGEKFTAWDGYIKGKNLHVVSGKNGHTVVQTWRATDWQKSDEDSILILNFEDTESGAQVRLVQVRVPDNQHASLTQGWKDFYWKPWRRHLKAGGK